MQRNPDPTVQRGRRSRVATGQTLAILQQWQAGTPVLELCRPHSLKANAMDRWQKQLDHGLRDQGELIPKSRRLPLPRKLDALERALGRQALAVDLLKQFCELKEPRLPEGM